MNFIKLATIKSACVKSLYGVGATSWVSINRDEIETRRLSEDEAKRFINELFKLVTSNKENNEKFVTFNQIYKLAGIRED